MNDEVREQFLTLITSIPYIKNLISKDRKRAIDLPRDSEGKIIVDITNPHILEDMDYFRPSALHFKEHGCFTKLKPNANPASPFKKWFDEEVRRCKYGYVRESDGEWVTGDYYYFLNYSPFNMSRASKDNPEMSIRVQDFPDVWDGHYYKSHFMHQARLSGKHYLELSSRGKGKTSYGSSLLSKRFVIGEARPPEQNHHIECIVTASDSTYLTGTNQILTVFQDQIDFMASYTEAPSKRLRDSLTDMQWVMGYIDSVTGIKRGTKNSVTGVTSNKNSSKIRGSRASLYIIEEGGTFPNLTTVYSNLRPSVEQGNKTFGTIVIYGTAGDKNSDFRSMEELMYHPDAYNLYSIPNIYDISGTGKPSFTFFFPAYLNYSEDCYDANGNSDVIKALVHILNSRYVAKYHSDDPENIIKRTAEYPITPQDAIINVNNDLFPVSELKARKAEIDSNPSFYDSVYVGDIHISSSGETSFTPTTDKPIRDFPIKGTDKKGAIEFYTLPQKDSTNRVIPNRYIIGIDPYENDKSDSSVSLGSILVLDLWTDDIVAEYTGRPTYADDFYEIARKMALFYNARINYENNKKGLFAYFQKMNSLYLLTDTLEFLKDKQMLKANTFGNSSKGTVASATINNYALGRSLDWLNSPREITYEEDGITKTMTVKSLYYLKSKALLEELIAYNSIGNFDRISALGMLMLLREDRIIHHSINKNEDSSVKSRAQDDFFLENLQKAYDGYTFVPDL